MFIRTYNYALFSLWLQFYCISDKDNGSTTPHPSLLFVIVLAVIAVIVLLVALVILVVHCKRKRCGKKWSHSLAEGIDDVDELTESKNDRVSSNQTEKHQMKEVESHITKHSPSPEI